MLNEDASSMDLEYVYDARNEMPWLKRFLRLASRALYEELAMPSISPVEEYVHGGDAGSSVHPEFSRRWSALLEVEIGSPLESTPGT